MPVSCRLCGGKFGTLARHVWFKHGVTGGEYLARFPGAALFASEVTRKSARTNQKLFADRNREAERRHKIRTAALAQHANRTREEADRIAAKISGTLLSRSPETLAIHERRRLRAYRKSVVSTKKTLRERHWSRNPEKRASTIRKIVKADKAYREANPEKVSEWIRKAFVAAKCSPNGAEKYLAGLLKPLGFRYVGDRTFWVYDEYGRMNPDYYRAADGAIVELLGHTHTKMETARRMRRLRRAGYFPVYIWHRELTSGDAVELVEKRLRKATTAGA